MADNHFRHGHSPSAHLSVHEASGRLRRVRRVDRGRNASLAAAQVRSVRIRVCPLNGPRKTDQRIGGRSDAERSRRVRRPGQGVCARRSRSDLRHSGHRRSTLFYVRAFRQGRSRRHAGEHPEPV